LLPTVVRVRWAVRRSDDVEALVSRLAREAETAPPRRHWCGPWGTDQATRTALRILGPQPTDIVTRPLVVYLAAIRERWPATFVSAVAVVGGHLCEHAWVEIEGRSLGAVAPYVDIDHREMFRHRTGVVQRLVPATG